MLLTVGHGRLDGSGLAELLVGAGVQQLVDVRRYPGSRRQPEVSRESLQELLPRHGVAYRWEERLGGRRRVDGEPVDTWWQVTQFQAYAAWTRTPEFGAAMAELLTGGQQQTTAVMCSESVWWRCHRRLIGDVAVLAHGVEVRHLMHDGRLGGHRVAEGARLTGAGVVWDGAAPAS
ncbi:DUF488 family protein [Auraticoccus sp. F435]|uniref:DUF488 family protein n=1 Tax=Auraticoccus cholistanensis TaxID=2656650 RepID=A0A6A9V126_9ACTN|nr:DUF488 domain-containing protein [Auraticoccus cholistanensis]MVA76679.1 DUF488 family protein [Auraticoccus cholistanensis]